jgi:hypothetical protein
MRRHRLGVRRSGKKNATKKTTSHRPITIHEAERGENNARRA